MPRVRVAAAVNMPDRAGRGPRGEIRAARSARPAELAPAVRPSDSASPPHRGGMRPAGSYCAAHQGELGRIAAGDPEAYPGFRDDLDAQQNYIQKAPPRARRGVLCVRACVRARVRACVRACVRAWLCGGGDDDVAPIRLRDCVVWWRPCATFPNPHTPSPHGMQARALTFEAGCCARGVGGSLWQASSGRFLLLRTPWRPSPSSYRTRSGTCVGKTGRSW